MAEPNAKILAFGRLQLVVYDFHKAGDELPVHIHDASSNHISIVAKGSIKIVGHPGLVDQVLTCGKVVDWEHSVPHGFVALEDNTRIVNVMK